GPDPDALRQGQMWTLATIAVTRRAAGGHGINAAELAQLAFPRGEDEFIAAPRTAMLAVGLGMVFHSARVLRTRRARRKRTGITPGSRIVVVDTDRVAVTRGEAHAFD